MYYRLLVYMYPLTKMGMEMEKSVAECVSVCMSNIGSVFHILLVASVDSTLLDDDYQNIIIIIMAVRVEFADCSWNKLLCKSQFLFIGLYFCVMFVCNVSVSLLM